LKSRLHRSVIRVAEPRLSNARSTDPTGISEARRKSL
jgi:hypothetical protein